MNFLIFLFICGLLATLSRSQPVRRSIVKPRKLWKKSLITWTFRDPHRLFKKDGDFNAVRSILRRSFLIWQSALDGTIEFREIDAKDLPEKWKSIGNVTEYSYSKPPDVDVDILFAKFGHGDRESFDGVGGTIAHSGYPPEGVLHFDASEHWSSTGNGGLDLRFVALHEIGHVLGLRHLLNEESIMNSYYRNLSSSVELSPIDIRAIQKLYRLGTYNSKAMHVR